MHKKIWNVADIAGSEVFSTEGERLGRLVDVLPSGSNDVWVISSDAPRPREILIPALSTVVRSVDAENKRIIVDLPPGLKEIYEETR